MNPDGKLKTHDLPEHWRQKADAGYMSPEPGGDLRRCADDLERALREADTEPPKPPDQLPEDS